MSRFQGAMFQFVLMLLVVVLVSVWHRGTGFFIGAGMVSAFLIGCEVKR